MQILKEKWQSYTSNEKRILGSILVIVIIVLLYSFVWSPGQKARQKLATSILKKQSQLTEMQTQAEQIDSLKRMMILLRHNPQSLKSAVEASAKLHGLSLKADQITLIETGELDISLPMVSFDDWVHWVDGLQSEHHILIKSCHIETNGNTGSVKVQARLVAG